MEQNVERVIMMILGEDENTGKCVYEKQHSGHTASEFAEQIQGAFQTHQQSVSDGANEEEFLFLRCLIPNSDGSAENALADWDLEEELLELLDPLTG